VSVCVFKSLGVFVCKRRSRGVGRTSEIMMAREMMAREIREIVNLSRHKSITHSRSARKTKGGNATVRPDRTVHKLRGCGTSCEVAAQVVRLCTSCEVAASKDQTSATRKKATQDSKERQQVRDKDKDKKEAGK